MKKCRGNIGEYDNLDNGRKMKLLMKNRIPVNMISQDNALFKVFCFYNLQINLSGIECFKRLFNTYSANFNII